jgi:hypothetical protein
MVLDFSYQGHDCHGTHCPVVGSHHLDQWVFCCEFVRLRQEIAVKVGGHGQDHGGLAAGEMEVAVRHPQGKEFQVWNGSKKYFIDNRT